MIRQPYNFSKSEKVYSEKIYFRHSTKAALLFNNKLYHQKDGVSIGASSGLLLAKLIMTKLENITLTVDGAIFSLLITLYWKC